MFILLYQPFQPFLSGTKYVFKNQDVQMFGVKLNKYKYFHPLHVVGRGSETQLQVGGR